MANNWEKAISILAGNLNSGLSYLITTVPMLVAIAALLTQKFTHFNKGKLISRGLLLSSILPKNE